MDKEPILLQFGHKVQEIRKARNLSQEQLAELSNISIHGVSNIETGKADVKYTNLLRIAKAFDLRVCELLDFSL